ncbi:MAG: hypothetical protein Q4G36_08195 [Paracoccus sp. (in: a-proteobacteria)]|nr:hypothetical protein [Paracoccus sp. (in: a-proteobacteria)]
MDEVSLYGSGAVMGFTPREVREMTLDEFDACVAGYNRAQGTGPAPELSDADHAALEALGEQFNREKAGCA